MKVACVEELVQRLDDIFEPDSFGGTGSIIKSKNNAQ